MFVIGDPRSNQLSSRIFYNTVLFFGTISPNDQACNTSQLLVCDPVGDLQRIGEHSLTVMAARWPCQHQLHRSIVKGQQQELPDTTMRASMGQSIHGSRHQHMSSA